MIKQRDMCSQESAISMGWSIVTVRVALLVFRIRKGGESVRAVGFVTTYCRQNGKQPIGEPIKEERIDTLQSIYNQENQVTEMWLQGFLGSNKPEMAEAV